jgi:hypothetical protein
VTPARRRREDRGVALVDVMIGLTILAFVTASLFTVFLSGIAQAHLSGVRGEAAAWAQSELEYLRYAGYGSPCLAAGTRTLTATSSGCGPLEPALPADLAQATVQVENNIGQAGLKRITLAVYQFPGTLLYKAVTYETQFL